jgi:predicted small metal-binding protein
MATSVVRHGVFPDVRCRPGGQCDRPSADIAPCRRHKYGTLASQGRIELSGREETDMTDANPTAKTIACGDVVPGCTFTASAPTEEELLKKVIAHAAHDHGVTEVTPELAAKVKAAIKTS